MPRFHLSLRQREFHLEIVPMDRVAVVRAPLGDPEASLLVQAPRLRQMIDCPEEYFAKAALTAPFESGEEEGLARAASVIGRVHDKESKLHSIWSGILAENRDRTHQHAANVGRQDEVRFLVIVLDKIAEFTRNQELKGRP